MVLSGLVLFVVHNIHSAQAAQWIAWIVSLYSAMTEVLNFLQSPVGKVIVMLAVLAILVVVGVYVVLRFRGRTGDDRPSTQDMLTNFREMYERGDISDQEFRKLKTALSGKSQEELNGTADKGYDQKGES